MTALALAVSVTLCLILLVTITARPTGHRSTHPSKYLPEITEHRRLGLLKLQALPATAPQQIIASIGDAPNTFFISYVTFARTPTTFVQWGDVSGAYTRNATGTAVDFTDPNPQKTLRVIHTVTIAVMPTTSIYYRVGCAATNVWSNETVFTAPPSGAEPVVMAVYGDLGHVNGRSMKNLLAEVEAKSVDMITHNGDWAYNLDTNNGIMGDLFMNDIQPFASRIPYVGSLGNHESAYNFTHWSQRLALYNALGVESGSGSQNWWFSWEYMSGNAVVHMSAISTEVYYHDELADQLAAQAAWLARDLAQCQKTADWCIVYGHRPAYCSNNDDLPDCSTDAQRLREGINGKYGLDDILKTGAVDIYFSAHEHSYERTYPLYKNKGELTQQNHTYTNYQSPVHIVSGAAGCQEDLDYYANQQEYTWSVVRSATYGYGHMIVHNATHLYWQQFLDEGMGGTDSLWMIKPNKGHDIQQQQHSLTQEQ